MIDHFDPLEERVWNQRYWAVDDFYKPEYGPVLLYICGEGTCNGLPNLKAWTAQLAKMFDGLVLVLEHRYYGESMPFGDKSFLQANMKYLTVD